MVGRDGKSDRGARTAQSNDKVWRGWVAITEIITESPPQEECVDPWRPLSMITCQQKRFLTLVHPSRPARLRRIVIGSEIAGLGVVIDRLQVEAVLGVELLLNLKIKEMAGEIFVGSLAPLGAIAPLDGVAHVSEATVLSGGLSPVSPAQILGLGNQADPVPFKEARIFLLGNGLRDGTRSGRGEQVGHQILAQPRGFVAQIDPMRIPQSIVGVGEE